MSHATRRGASAIVGLMLAAAVQAQPPTPRADPLDPRAAVPPAVHRSALADYKPAGEVTVGSWRDANDTVNRIGGWRAYAKEAAQAAAARAASAPGKP